MRYMKKNNLNRNLNLNETVAKKKDYLIFIKGEACLNKQDVSEQSCSPGFTVNIYKSTTKNKKA